jgi:WD40 repeat protein
VSGLTFTPDGRRLIAAAGDAYEQQWVSWDLTPAAPNPIPAPLAQFTALAPGGRVAVRPDTFNRADAPAEFVDPLSGKRVSRFDPPETGDTVIISRFHSEGNFSGDGRRFVGARRSERGPGGQQEDLGLAVWDVATGKRLAQRPPEKSPVDVAAVSPDGKAVAVLRRATELVVWEPDTGRTRWARKLGSAVAFVRFTRGGSWLVVQEIYLPGPPHILRIPPPPRPHPLLVLDAATGKELLKVNGPDLGEPPLVFADEGFSTVPSARAISADGRAAAFSGFDGTISLWELATDRERCRITHPGPVHDLAFSPDGRLLAAASLAAPVVVYDLYGTRRGGTPEAGPLLPGKRR